MKIEISWRKLIKPSLPTPSNLRKLKLSRIDQLQPSVYMRIVFYYPAGNGIDNDRKEERSNHLEKSLSEVLTLFYPLAGRYIKDHLLIDCNDQGVEYSKALVHGQVLAQLDRCEAEELDGLAPSLHESDTSLLLSIQINTFDCGGLAIGFTTSHRIINGFTLNKFVRSWATATRQEDIKQVIPPSFGDFSSLIPAKEDDQPFPQQLPPPPQLLETKFVTKRFVFNGNAIALLKAKANNSGAKTSRAQLVSALIWRTLIRLDQAKRGHPRPSLLFHAMDLRGQKILPQSYCGNLYGVFSAKFMPAESGAGMELHELALLLGSAIRDSATDMECERKLHGDDGLMMKVINSYKDLNVEITKGEVDVYSSSSLSAFRLYEVDFGLGNPSWITSGSMNDRVFLLMDTKCGSGIEAWVSLEEKDMIHFQQDLDILGTWPARSLAKF